MSGRKQSIRRSVLVGAIVVVLAGGAWGLVLLSDLWPIQDAAEAARAHAAAQGYRMEGYLGQLTRQPDVIGSCEAKVEFRDTSDSPPKRRVTVRLRRAWRLSGWEVTETTVEDLPPQPR